MMTKSTKNTKKRQWSQRDSPPAVSTLGYIPSMLAHTQIKLSTGESGNTTALRQPTPTHIPQHGSSRRAELPTPHPPWTPYPNRAPMVAPRTNFPEHDPAAGARLLEAFPENRRILRLDAGNAVHEVQTPEYRPSYPVQQPPQHPNASQYAHPAWPQHPPQHPPQHVPQPPYHQHPPQYLSQQPPQHPPQQSNPYQQFPQPPLQHPFITQPQPPGIPQRLYAHPYYPPAHLIPPHNPQNNALHLPYVLAQPPPMYFITPHPLSYFLSSAAPPLQPGNQPSQPNTPAPAASGLQQQNPSGTNEARRMPKQKD